MYTKVMQIRFKPIVDKNAVFYYVLQAVSGWDTSEVENDLYKRYEQDYSLLVSHDPQGLSKIRHILKASTDPRSTLAQLYSGQIKNEEAIQIADLAQSFQEIFDTLWPAIETNLQRQRKQLARCLTEDFYSVCYKVIQFYGATVAQNNEILIYLLPNKKGRGASGHTITTGDFILFHSATFEDFNKMIVQNSAVLLHEFTHYADFKSSASSEIIKPVHEAMNVTSVRYKPTWMSWRMFYSEAIAYSIGNSKTGGMLAPYLPQDQLIDDKRLMNLIAQKQNGGELSFYDEMMRISVVCHELTAEYLTGNKKLDTPFAKNLLEHIHVRLIPA